MFRKFHFKLHFITRFGVILLLLSLAGNVHAAGVFDSISEEVNRIFKDSSPAIVKVRTISGSNPLAGTGFFINDSGLILTSYAVVRDSQKAWIEYEERKLTAEVLGKDPRSGVALLKVNETDTPFLKLGDSSEVKMASGLVSVAYPYNLPVAPAFGFVTGFDVRYLNRFFATTHIRASVKVSPGQIGGPLINTKGDVVGLMVLAVLDGKECYALPANSASRIIDDILENGKARHGWVGVGVIESKKSESDLHKSVIVSNLYRDTPAAQSGLEPGDVVRKIGDQVITTPSDILDAAFFSTVGKPVPVEVIRNGEKMVFSLPIVERPEQQRPVDSLIKPGKDTMIAPFVSPEEQKEKAKTVPASGKAGKSQSL
ncbi:MAG: S1C family serine protease [Gammaproteobacteria bacterium]|nr:S1C family serine protease [Gammaproteobacteria bacterium]